MTHFDMKKPTNTASHWEATWSLPILPEPPAPFTQTGENELELLKNRLLKQALAQVVNTDLTAPIRRAANEAAALAWLEPHPLLVFPTLFEEKTSQAKRRTQKQNWVKSRSSNWIAWAA